MPDSVIGIDEAGRGPVIGPMVVCAIKLPKADYNILKKLGVDDSKKLSKIKRQKIYQLILKESEINNWKIFVNICKASEIDIGREKMNINELEINLFSESIQQISNAEDNDEIFLDACDVNEDRFGISVRNKLGSLWENNIIISKHKMDQMNLAVGAASIIAKVVRDEEILRIGNKLDFQIGSGYPSDPVTIIAVQKMISSEYPHDELRWSWATTKNAWIKHHNNAIPIRCGKDTFTM
ncbi:MAG: ribonuclease HII [Candidatus Poseidoniales archaeon]|jgi:ribonuclease HII|tara:strand:- start:1659 stop:2372 length:714 start_codon:yes stop_codon:yes gene_type:complete